MPPTIDPQVFRDVFSTVPTAVTIVAGVPAGEAEPRALVIGSFVSVSLDPPLAGFFIGASSSTWPALRTSPLLTFSVLAEHQEDVCRTIAQRKCAELPEDSWNRGVAGALSVKGSVATLTGIIESEVPAGDHVLVLVRVQHAEAGERDPLIFHRRQYRTLPTVVRE